MPALPNVPGVIRAELGYTIGADIDAITRLYLQYSSGAPSVVDMTSLATGIASDFTSHLANLMTSDYALTSVKLTDLASPLGVEVSQSESISGIRSGAQMAAAVSLLVNYTIARRYRGGKPRSYFPFGVATDLGSSDQWGSTFITACNTDIAAFFTAVLGGSYGALVLSNHVNVSYYSGFHTFTTPSGRVKNIPTLRGTPLVDVITALSSNIRPGSQRRRNQHSS